MKTVVMIALILIYFFYSFDISRHFEIFKPSSPLLLLSIIVQLLSTHLSHI